ncbi:MAG TPA: glycosyltransferase family 2 protein [Verrucomicrobiae bacterium]
MNTSGFPKLSTITPSFNQGRFLEETILSVLNQSYPNLEYIIIDGGSTDNSVEIIKKYERHLAYWVSEPDKGQTHAVNKGLDRATGDIIGWINSDDVYVKGAFKKVANAFLEHPNVILVHGDRIMLDAESHVSGWGALPPFDPDKTCFCVCSETAFWQSSLTKGARLKEELQYAMDLEFFCRLYRLGPFLKLNAYLGYFRCYQGNKTSTITTKGQEEAEREWKAVFGKDHEGLRHHLQSNYLKLLFKLMMHPALIGVPYVYRRFILGKRGM